MFTRLFRRKVLRYSSDNTEILWRSFWFAAYVIHAVLRQGWILSERCGESQERAYCLRHEEFGSALFLETLAYTVSFATEKLWADIMQMPGDSNTNEELAMAHKVYISIAFDKLLKLPKPRKKPNTAFWHLIDFYEDPPDEYYNDHSLFDAQNRIIPELLFAKRACEVTSVSRIDVLVDTAVAYRRIGLSFLHKAFITRKSLSRLMSETATRYASWPRLTE